MSKKSIFKTRRNQTKKKSFVQEKDKVTIRTSRRSSWSIMPKSYKKLTIVGNCTGRIRSLLRRCRNADATSQNFQSSFACHAITTSTLPTSACLQSPRCAPPPRHRAAPPQHGRYCRAYRRVAHRAHRRHCRCLCATNGSTSAFRKIARCANRRRRHAVAGIERRRRHRFSRRLDKVRGIALWLKYAKINEKKWF